MIAMTTSNSMRLNAARSRGRSDTEQDEDFGFMCIRLQRRSNGRLKYRSYLSAIVAQVCVLPAGKIDAGGREFIQRALEPPK